ncbi:MAG: type II toxin-antitoxin system VapC family toxin [Chloroflexi bacterium]|nr:type II toxin-antitoxin system VapC family toxin [Chloroflexota bacterium]
MRRYLLDTTPLAAYFHGRPAALELVAPWLRQREVATSVLVYGELIEHLEHRPDFPRHRNQLRELLREVPAYFLTYPIMERYAAIRRALRQRRSGLIGDIDTLVAATALERGLTVVTSDADFERVPGLKTMLIPRQSLDARQPSDS